MKIKGVEVTKPELDALEDVAIVWILCKKHNAEIYGKNEIQIYKMQNSCKSCTKEKIIGKDSHNHKTCQRVCKNRMPLWSKKYFQPSSVPGFCSHPFAESTLEISRSFDLRQALEKLPDTLLAVLAMFVFLVRHRAFRVRSIPFTPYSARRSFNRS